MVRLGCRRPDITHNQQWRNLTLLERMTCCYHCKLAHASGAEIPPGVATPLESVRHDGDDSYLDVREEC